MSKLKGIALKVLNARYSIASWLWAIVGLLTTGVLYIQLNMPNVPAVHEFTEALPINPMVLVLVLLVSHLLMLIGMGSPWKMLARYGAFGAFSMWVIAALAFILTSNVVSLVLTVVPLIVFCAHVFLASILRDETQI